MTTCQSLGCLFHIIPARDTGRVRATRSVLGSQETDSEKQICVQVYWGMISGTASMSEVGRVELDEKVELQSSCNRGLIRSHGSSRTGIFI